MFPIEGPHFHLEVPPPFQFLVRVHLRVQVPELLHLSEEEEEEGEEEEEKEETNESGGKVGWESFEILI